jgi:hypothetical protein
MGTISVVSEPESCWVRIDSVLVGKTPLNELDLEAGEHLVEVYPPQQGIWNLQERFFRPVIKAGEHTSLKVVFQPPVFINSIPYGAQLWSDTTRFGLTPLYIPFEENRGRLFKLLKEGYKPYEFILKENQSILARMERGKDYMDDESDPRLLGFVSKKHLKSKFTLLALTVATHWTSFYFKNKADDYHQEYLTSSDPQEIQEAWDKTQKYDTLSSITLGISYASLAGLIYMVIWK